MTNEIIKIKVKKYNYYNVIQQNYGYGWEDNSEYECFSTGEPKNIKDRQLLINDLKEYRLTGYSTRLIFRKVKNEIKNETL